jgi:hypothetical protein
MVGPAAQVSLAQRTGLALADALRHDCGGEALLANGRIRSLADLLIDGVDDERLPDSLDRTRLRSPDSATALAINSFLPWHRAPHDLPLAGFVGFDAISSRCAARPACAARRRTSICWRSAKRPRWRSWCAAAST